MFYGEINRNRGEGRSRLRLIIQRASIQSELV